MSNSTGVRSLLSKILFIVGVIIILVLLAWAVLNFVPAVFSSFSKAGSSFGKLLKPGGDITVLVNNKDLSSGERFSTYWEYSATEPGTYSITHECVENANFDIHIGQDTKRLICNTPLTLPADTVNVEMTAFNSKVDSFVDVPIVVYYTPTGQTESKYNGKSTVTIKNEGAVAGNASPQAGNLASATLTGEQIPAKTNQPAAQPTNTAPVTRVQNYYAPVYASRADLAISNTYSYPNQSALQFDIYNIGGSNSGVWQFTYTDPSQGNKVQYSPLQISLAPGQGMRFNLSFSSQEKNSEVVVISVDPLNTISENSESNNNAYVNVTGRGTGSTNNNNNTTTNYDPNDDADLYFGDLEVGRLSGSRFVEDDTAEEGDDVAIRFEVRNKGGESTGSWRFEVDNMPFDNDDTYRSDRQDSLKPGEVRELTLEFENIDSGNYTIKVILDSSKDVKEESESNNTKTVKLEVKN